MHNTFHIQYKRVGCIYCCNKYNNIIRIANPLCFCCSGLEHHINIGQLPRVNLEISDRFEINGIYAFNKYSRHNVASIWHIMSCGDFFYYGDLK